ncbi:MAG: hypothetical protein R3E65_02825 [Steroidobacteraceae bacterium]
MADDLPREASAYSVEDCRVPAASEKLEYAICRADIVLLSDAILALGVSVPADDYPAASRNEMRVLARVFKGDRSIGENLPWTELHQGPFRASAAVQIAASVLSGSDFGVDPAELWDFAWEYWQKPTSFIPRLLMLAILDHPRAFGLIEKELSDAPTGSEKFSIALKSLQEICDPRAIELLRKLSDSADRERAKMASEAASFYLTNTVRWCQGRGRRAE